MSGHGQHALGITPQGTRGSVGHINGLPSADIPTAGRVTSIGAVVFKVVCRARLNFQTDSLHRGKDR